MRPSVRRQVAGWIAGGLVCAVWLGTPCTSFSQAQQFWRGKFPLRNAQHPAGCPWVKDMPPHTQELVRTGNALAIFSATVVRHCLRLGIPVALENPGSSLLWQMPQVVALQRSSVVFVISVDYCLYGMPWRKRTKLLFANVDLHSLATRCSSKRGCCDRTGEQHVQLAGAQDGVLRTKLAEPYPARLCRGLARAFSAAMRCR